MRPTTPQPDDFDARQRARQGGLARPQPPRVIVSGDEAEDASEWEVVVVENEAIDDQRALEIARERHRQQRLANLPSLDERDIAQALGIGAEGEAEAPDGIDSDAFVLPDDTPPARRIVGPAPLPVGLIFDGVEEPGADEAAAADDDVIEGPTTRFPLEPAEEAEEATEPAGEALAAEADAAAGTPAAGTETGDDEGPGDPTSSWNPVPLESRVTFDDVDLGFYDIGDEAIDAPVIAEEAPPAEDPVEAGLDRDADGVPADDPSDDFYAVDDKDPLTALEPPKPKVYVPPTEPVKLWGTGRAKQVDGKVYAPGEVPHDEEVPEEDDFASSFPIDPDEFLTEEGAEVAVDELDYASVFGPVDAPPVAAPVPVAAPLHDADPMEVAAHAPITESPARRRRRKAAAAGATVAGIVAKGKTAKAAEPDEADRFEDLRPEPGEPDVFADLQAIETDETEWGWRDEFLDDGADHPDHIHAAAGYAYAFDDELLGPPQPLLVDQRPRHIREEAQPRRGRRELIALGAAGLVVLAVGVGSKVFNSADRPELVQGSDAPATSIERATTSTTLDDSSSTTVSPFGTGILTTVPGDTTATSRPRTTTTAPRRGATPPPSVTSTTVATTSSTATTAPPDTTPTTEPPTTAPPTTGATLPPPDE